MIQRELDLPRLIVITGAPGSGKTTLGRQIAQRFHLPIIAKDDIKESLFDSLGWKDRAWSIQVGRATYGLIYYFVEAQLAAGRSLVVESNFDAESAGAKFSELRSRHNFAPLQIVLTARSDVLVERFKLRAHTQARHPGHVDQLSTDAEIAAVCQREYAPLDLGGKILEIDTTDLEHVDYTNVFSVIQAELSSPSRQVSSK